MDVVCHLFPKLGICNIKINFALLLLFVNYYFFLFRQSKKTELE